MERRGEGEQPGTMGREALAYADGLYNLARYLTRNESDAEDLVQETYTRAFNAAAQFTPGTNLKAWLFRILRNTFVSHYRRERHNPVTGGLDTVTPSLPPAADIGRQRDSIELDRLRKAAAEASSPATRRPWPKRWAALAVAAVLVLVTAPLAWQVVLAPSETGRSAMVTEAVNDHVRLLQSQRPLEIESKGIHQVIPWFSGRLDFAPGVRFAGDADFPLRGGAVGYFLDRKAATLVYGRRLHSFSVFVVKAEGLPWPRRGLERVGRLEVYRTSSRGFNVMLWRDGELGYALVSDVGPKDLTLLAEKFASSS